LIGGTAENLSLRARFETGTSGIWSSTASHSTVTFSLMVLWRN
jgi:hypothetical protein